MAFDPVTYYAAEAIFCIICTVILAFFAFGNAFGFPFPPWCCNCVCTCCDCIAKHPSRSVCASLCCPCCCTSSDEASEKLLQSEAEEKTASKPAKSQQQQQQQQPTAVTQEAKQEELPDYQRHSASSSLPTRFRIQVWIGVICIFSCLVSVFVLLKWLMVGGEREAAFWDRLDWWSSTFTAFLIEAFWFYYCYNIW
jgi:hypothetical protein